MIVHFRNIVHKILICSIGTYLLCLSVFIGYLLSDFFSSAQAAISITILNNLDKIIRPDETIRYEAKLYRYKMCPADIWRFIVKRESDGIEETGYRDIIPGLFTQGNGKLISTISTMTHPPLEEGKYILRIYAVTHCSIITKIEQYPDEPFEVKSK